MCVLECVFVQAWMSVQFVILYTFNQSLKGCRFKSENISKMFSLGYTVHYWKGRYMLAFSVHTMFLLG